MRLLDALEILRRPVPNGAPPLRVALACGFTPLHVETFLAASLRQAHPGRSVAVETGLFGDLAGTLERTDPARVDALVAAIEWADVDPRLGIRSLGGWAVADIVDIVASATERVRRLEGALARLAASTTVACSLPTLPLPPLFSHGPAESGAAELELRSLLAAFAAAIAGAGVRVVGAQRLDELSPPGERLDAKAELTAGFPYRLGHAAALAGALAALVGDPAPKKGLITDLDDTLWAGLLGEVGVDGVGWTLERRAQQHGLYQQLLASLASAGVLIAVASKNEPALVEQAFARDDLLLAAGSVLPFEVSWGPKSAAVARILETWNVAPDSVVFVDDSPMELAEIGAAFPDVECIAFPGSDHGDLLPFLAHLRGLFGKRSVSDEDALRLVSIRSASTARASAQATGGSADDFLAGARGQLTFTCDREPDARALELINKTNQFNLNGRRIGEAEFRRLLEDPAAFLVTASYGDRFGPLGKIAAVLGRRVGDALDVETWVMSCRAFSRRIEHHCLAFLFERLDADEIVLDYEPTARNGVLREFLDTLGPAAPGRVSRDAFLEHSPALVHRVAEAAHA
jgi:FkbH-like protein